MTESRLTPTRATHALRLMARMYKSKDVTESPEWNALVHAIAELDRLYRLELIAEHAWCTKDVDHLNAVFGDRDLIPATSDSPCLEWQTPTEEEE